MDSLLNSYLELNPYNYDHDDVVALTHWAKDAYDELYRLKLANKRLKKINDLAEEV